MSAEEVKKANGGGRGGGGEAQLGLINPRPALVAIGRRVGRLRKREVRRLPPWHPAPPSSICPAPSRAERDI